MSTKGIERMIPKRNKLRIVPFLMCFLRDWMNVKSPKTIAERLKKSRLCTIGNFYYLFKGQMRPLLKRRVWQLD